jgi:hypothetical protein
MISASGLFMRLLLKGPCQADNLPRAELSLAQHVKTILLSRFATALMRDCD